MMQLPTPKKPPESPTRKVQWEKMSKSKGNVIRPEEVVGGVARLDDRYEFRDLVGDVIDYQAWGVWRDEIGDHLKSLFSVEVRGFIPKLYFTSTQYGLQPVFLHERDNPVPCLIRNGDGNEYPQHGYLCKWWDRLIEANGGLPEGI